MSPETIRERGQERLRDLESRGGAVGRWRTFLGAYQPRAEHPDDPCAWLTCTLALEGVAADNFGVGAALVDGAGRVLAEGHNQVFHPYFRSDRHAEMVVLERWEDGRPERPWPGGLTLYTSLEPCPMCLVRLCNADVRRVLFASPDPLGGMAQRLDGLPPSCRDLARGKTFAPARCSPELADAAAQIFRLNLDELNARLRPPG
jgi:cytosine deaminase